MAEDPPAADQKPILDPLAGLGVGALNAMAILACPHWLPASAVLQHFADELLSELPELLRLDLVRVTRSGGLAVPPALRDDLLSTRVDREQAAAIAARLAPVFEEGTNPESRIEAHYHHLLLNPGETARRMFQDALAWSSEPLFAFNLVQRLVKTWREFEARWGLDSSCERYLRFVELRGPVRRRMPRDEIDILKRIDARDDPLLEAHVRLREATALIALNQSDHAQNALRRAQDLFEMLGDLRGCAQTNRALGTLFIKIDRFDEASAHLEQALELSRRLNNPVGYARSLQGLAEIDSYRGDFCRATSRFEEAIEIMAAHGGRTGEAHSRLLFSQLLTMQGELDGAAAHIRRATEIYATLDSTLGTANGLRMDAAVDLEAGRLDSARAKTDAARTAFQSLGTLTGQAACLEIDAQIALAMGDFAGASARLREALSLFVKADDRYGAANCLRDLGVLALHRNDTEAAVKMLNRSAARFDKIGANLEADLARVMAAIAEGSPEAAADARRRLGEAGVKLPRAYLKAPTRTDDRPG